MVSKGGWQGFWDKSVWASFGDKSIAKGRADPEAHSSSYKKHPGPLSLAREGACAFFLPQELEVQPAKQRLNTKMKAERLFCLCALI